MGSKSSPNISYSQIAAIALEKLRPHIIKQIEATNHFHKMMGVDIVTGGTIKPPIQTAETQQFYKEDGPVKRRFEYVGGKHKKYWEIDSPHPAEGEGDWLVHVHYGRIGTDGNHHTKEFGSEWLAEQYYKKIVASKIDKGYIEEQATKKKKATKVPVCAHATIANLGDGRFRCKSCKALIELGAQVPKTNLPSVEKKVKRYMNLNWRNP